MPRKVYIPKCSYCRRSKLTDRQFEVVLWLFIQGATAEEVAGLIVVHAPSEESLSDKTVGRYFRRIGKAIWHRFVEPRYLMVEEFAAVKNENSTAWDGLIAEAVGRKHEEYLSLLRDKRTSNANRRKSNKPDHVAAAYRKMSAKRNGIGMSKLEAVGFAFFQEDYIQILRAKLGNPTQYEIQLNMWQLLKFNFKSDPI